MVIRSKEIPYNKEELETEVWRVIQGYPKYEASIIGRIRNKDTKRILDTRLDSDGYVVVTLSNPKSRHSRKVHRIIAIAFIANPGNKETVNHKDGNKQNNRDWNLEWSTHRENVNHAVDNGLYTNSTVVRVTDITNNTTKTYMSINRMASDIGVDPFGVLPYIKYSKEYPVLGKYIINIDDRSELEPINSSGRVSKTIYIYDALTKTWYVYNSMLAVTFHININRTSLSKHLNNFGYLHYNGYSVMYEKDITKVHINLNLKEVKDNREKHKSSSYVKRDHTYLMYDYSTKTEYEFKSIDEVVNYLLPLYPVAIAITNQDIISMLGRSSVYKKSWLVKGYGLKSSIHNYGWYPYTEEVIVNNRYGKCKRNAVYQNIDTKEYIFGNYELCKYLDVFLGTGNPRSTINNYIETYGLDKLVSISKYPQLKLRRLEHLIKIKI